MYKRPLLPGIFAPVANATRALRISLLCISVSVCFFQLRAQTALLKDINRALANNSSSEFSNFAVTSQKMFFTSYGNWWTSGGTTESTLFLKKFSGVSSKAVIGSQLFFNGTDGNGESELWKTNGTVAGTLRVKDVFPGLSGSFPDKLTVVNGKLFFVANDGTKGRELWISDGTLVGTKMISDIMKGSGSSNPGNLTVVNAVLFFTANDGQHGYELWKTDGTAAGTVMVKDIRGGEKVSSSPAWLANVNDVIFFSATNGSTGSELWKSDGTDAGTVFVKDIQVGSVSSGIENLINLNGMAMFTANDGIHGDELWKSNGTASGTMLVKDLNPGPKGSNGTDYASQPMSNFTVIGNALYFAAGKGSNPEFYVRSDGTDVGTKILINTMHLGFNLLEPRFTYLNGYIYFFNLSPAGTFPGDNGYSTYNLVRMDLNGENIVSAKSLEKFSDYGGEEAPYQNVMVFNGKLFLNARMNGGLKFASFTTSTNTLTAIKDIDAPTLSSNPNFFVRVNDLVYFETNFDVSEQNEPWVDSPQELYRTDGTTSGTFKIANLKYGSKVAINDKLFFSRSLDTGWSLCFTYGTPGTITTLLSGTGTNVPRNLTNVHGLLYYFNDAGELWKSDGTTTGTVLLGNLNTILSITDVNGKAFMLAQTADGGLELWRTNATGLLKVKTFRTGPARTTRSYPTAAIGNAFYFVANDGIHGNEVWRSDGTSIGTYMISDANTSDDIDSYDFEVEIPSFTVYNNTLYYSAQDKGNNWALWSATGNVKLTGFDAVDNSIVFNGKMFLFPRIVPESRFHTIYVSDGTMAGTTYLGNLGDQGGISFTIMSDKLFFSSGQLTTSDGTECGTYRIPGVYSAYPIEGIGNDLLFASISYKTGGELFVYRDLGSITNPVCPESVTSNRQTSETNSITVYPNPYTDEFTLNIKDSDGESIDIEVYDASGFPIQIIQDMQSNTHLGHFGANWPKGIYFLKANVGGRITTTRIAKR